MVPHETLAHVVSGKSQKTCTKRRAQLLSSALTHNMQTHSYETELSNYLDYESHVIGHVKRGCDGDRLNDRSLWLSKQNKKKTLQHRGGDCPPLGTVTHNNTQLLSPSLGSFCCLLTLYISHNVCTHGAQVCRFVLASKKKVRS